MGATFEKTSWRFKEERERSKTGSLTSPWLVYVALNVKDVFLFNPIETVAEPESNLMT